MRSKVVTVDSIRLGDVILLNDLESLKTMETFYLECYSATSDGMEVTKELQTAEVLDATNQGHTYRIQVRTHDQKILDLDLAPSQKILICDPKEVPVEKLRKNDEILLRGDNSPEHLDKGYKYALIAARYGHASKILRIHKTWRGTYYMIALFGGVKPLKLIVDPGVLFEVSLSSGN
jgi:hypothetical protein